MTRGYPGMTFLVCDALALPFEARFDVVFSNAVFHWIADHDAFWNGSERVVDYRRLRAVAHKEGAR